MSLPAVLAARERTSDGFTLGIPQTWHQGRTAYGGFSAALALEAARLIGGEQLGEGKLPPLRSALVSFAGGAMRIGWRPKSEAKGALA